jgi:hypothetical protein
MHACEQAEHHARAMKNVPGVSFYHDEKRGRVGMLTTLQVKHAMCTLLNAMLRCVSAKHTSICLAHTNVTHETCIDREDRVCCTSGDDFVTCNLKEDEVKRLLRDELEVYSYQFKQASTVFNKGQVKLD